MTDTTTTLELDFADIADCEKEIEMLGNGLARSCNYLAESSKSNADKHQMRLANEMDKGADANLETANEHANKFKYFESQQRKWLGMLAVVERAGFSDQQKVQQKKAQMDRDELEAIANALSK